MSVALFFWIFWLIAVIYTLWAGGPLNGKSAGSTVILFALIGLLGWKCFGALIK